MRVYTDIDEDRERVVVTFRETLDLHDIREHMFTSEKARVVSFPCLLDSRQATIQISSREIDAILQDAHTLSGHSRLGNCAVAVSDASSLAIVQAAAVKLAGLVTVAGFLNVEEAHRWLGWNAPASSPDAHLEQSRSDACR